MSWIAAATIGSAVIGGMSAREKAKTQKAQNIAAAEQTRNSPWTNMGAGQLQSGAPSTAMGALQGGMGGFMQGQSIKNTNAANEQGKLASERAAEKHDMEMQLNELKLKRGY